MPQVAPALLMIVAGIWLVLQTVAGDLPRRLLSLSLWDGPDDAPADQAIGDRSDTRRV